MNVTEEMETALYESEAATEELRFFVNRIGARAQALRDPILLRQLGHLNRSVAQFLRTTARWLELADEANP